MNKLNANGGGVRRRKYVCRGPEQTNKLSYKQKYCRASDQQRVNALLCRTNTTISSQERARALHVQQHTPENTYTCMYVRTTTTTVLDDRKTMPM